MEMEYICLREEFLSAAHSHITNDMLNAIKEYFAQDINSNRRVSQIKELGQLLKVLEKRDILSFNNIDPLFYISNYFLSDMQMQKRIKDYKTNFENMKSTMPCSAYNFYEEIGDNNPVPHVNKGDISQIKEPNQQDKKSTLQTQVGHERNFSEQEFMMQQILLSHISERIGRSWRDTARYLGIPEHQIDAIQNKHAFDLKEQSYEALKFYISQCSTDCWKLNLLRALERARRRDLKEFAEKLILGLNEHL